MVDAIWDDDMWPLCGFELSIAARDSVPYFVKCSKFCAIVVLMACYCGDFWRRIKQIEAR